ncbi:hypothetical protein [Actinomadura madurae]|uniref:hypothetical protein n=1 Tax=Actinomadura madurae TaxID=1993 RepID=UPI0027E2AFAE|nr:hypothetical protein [Actinomadura madurae]
MVENRREGESRDPRVAPDQPGFDPSRADPALGRDDPYLNEYLDGLYDAKHESEAALRALVHDPELAEMGADPKLRPGDKDRTRALDKIMGDYDGDPSGSATCSAPASSSVPWTACTGRSATSSGSPGTTAWKSCPSRTGCRTRCRAATATSR